MGRTVLTHGDLSSLNILAHGDDIVGIVDWATAGWYPSYWEYTTACQVNPQSSIWRSETDHFLLLRARLLTSIQQSLHFVVCVRQGIGEQLPPLLDRIEEENDLLVRQVADARRYEC